MQSILFSQCKTPVLNLLSYFIVLDFAEIVKQCEKNPLPKILEGDLYFGKLAEQHRNQLQEEAGSSCGADNTGNVRTHGVHEQEVGRIFLLAFDLSHTGSHRNGGYTGGTDQRVDLALGNPAHDVAKDDAAKGGEQECNQTQNDDKDGLPSQEGACSSGCADRGAEQDAKIAGIAHERGKGIIIAVNKWDAIEKDNNTVKQHTEKIRQILSFIPYAEILFISAKSGQRLNKIFELIDVVIENNSMRVATGVLNEIVTEAVAMQQPPTDKGKRLKIYYVTQVSVKPPTFVIFVNDKNLMHFSYTRYLENRIRDTFGFRGTALKFITRERKENE